MSTSRRAELARKIGRMTKRLAALPVPKLTPTRRRYLRIEHAKDALRDQAHYFVTVANTIEDDKRDAEKEAAWAREADVLYRKARALVRAERRSR